MLNKLDPGAYLNHVLDTVTSLVELPYKEHEAEWKKLLPWEINPKTLSWSDRINQPEL